MKKSNKDFFLFFPCSLSNSNQASQLKILLYTTQNSKTLVHRLTWTFIFSSLLLHFSLFANSKSIWPFVHCIFLLFVFYFLLWNVFIFKFPNFQIITFVFPHPSSLQHHPLSLHFHPSTLQSNLSSLHFNTSALKINPSTFRFNISSIFEIVIVVSEQSIGINFTAIGVSTQSCLNPDSNDHLRTSGMHLPDSSYLFKDS